MFERPAVQLFASSAKPQRSPAGGRASERPNGQSDGCSKRAGWQTTHPSGRALIQPSALAEQSARPRERYARSGGTRAGSETRRKRARCRHGGGGKGARLAIARRSHKCASQ